MRASRLGSHRERGPWRAAVGVGLVVLAIPVVAIVSQGLRFKHEQTEIERLSRDARRFGGKASIPPGGVDLWNKEITMELDLSGSNVGDDDFARMARMPAFRHLYILGLSRTRITDRTLHLLEGNRTMILLDVSGTKVTDQGMQSIPKLPRLSVLDLSGTAITDQGLEALIGRSTSMHLGSIDLTATRVTKEGVRKISKAFEHKQTYINHSFRKDFDDRR